MPGPNANGFASQWNIGLRVRVGSARARGYHVGMRYAKLSH